MFARFMQSIFWNSEQQRVAPAQASDVVPRVTPERVLLALLSAESFTEMESVAAMKARAGIAVGRMIERRVNGRLVDVTAKHYANLLDAAVDGRLADLEADVEDHEREVARLRDGVNTPAECVIGAAQAALDRARQHLAEARRLLPIARRWRILRDLQALDAVPPSQDALQGDDGPRVASTPVSTAASVPGFDSNIRSLNAERARIEQSHRDFQREKFEERGRAQIAALRQVDLADDTSTRIHLEAQLATWNAEHPSLVAEIAGA